ncbi:MAG: hypothetical protein M0P99_00205 [Candidatus Cloacimonetes bacterium]|jgi:hypothetical protein|nr:hypothetical protein [Candidatus Cloacimonadota bacterium]
MTKSKYFKNISSNTSGKPSASGLAGLLIVMIGGLSYITGVILLIIGIDKQDLLISSISLIYAGAALLGIRKLSRPRPYDYYRETGRSDETYRTYEDSESTDEPI